MKTQYKRMTMFTLALSIGLASAAGCATDAPTTEDEQVGEAAQALTGFIRTTEYYLTAARTGDPVGACTLINCQGTPKATTCWGIKTDFPKVLPLDTCNAP